MRKTLYIGILYITLIGGVTGCRPQPTLGFTPPLPNSPTLTTASPTFRPAVRPWTPTSVPNTPTLATPSQSLALVTTEAATLIPSPSPAFPLVPTETTASVPFPSPTPLDRPIQGMTLFNISSAQEQSLLTMAGGSWTRFDGIHWDAIEPLYQDPPNYLWETVNETDLIKTSAAGAEVIAIIMYAPNWAQKLPSIACGPYSEEAFDEFARFMQAVVSRYGKPPYHVKYWEIGNEPDIDPAFVPPQSGYGCWGDQMDDYYGGGYYAEMLKVVYPQIKATDPDAQVLVGGLLLDCDPLNPPEVSAGSGTYKDCSSSRFIEGILRNGGGDYFDGISFHAYDYYFSALGKYGHKGWHSAWNTTGPVISAKVNYLRGLLALYGHPEKYLMNTEVAILCGSNGNESICQTNEFSRTKANYLTQANAVAVAEGLRANMWFSLTGWRASGLVKGNLEPLPAYQAYQNSVIRLSKAVFSKGITIIPQVKGYEFLREGTVLWVLWSLDGEPHLVQLPSLPNAIYDVSGQSLPLDQNLTITLDPIYLEWGP